LETSCARKAAESGLADDPTSVSPVLAVALGEQTHLVALQARDVRRLALAVKVRALRVGVNHG